jgi:hypothetical protein
MPSVERNVRKTLTQGKLRHFFSSFLHIRLKGNAFMNLSAWEPYPLYLCSEWKQCRAGNKSLWCLYDSFVLRTILHGVMVMVCILFVDLMVFQTNALTRLPRRPISLLSTTANYSRKLFGKWSGGTLKKGACLMQASLVSVPVTARHFSVWDLRTTLP